MKVILSLYFAISMQATDGLATSGGKASVLSHEVDGTSTFAPGSDGHLHVSTVISLLGGASASPSTLRSYNTGIEFQAAEGTQQRIPDVVFRTFETDRLAEPFVKRLKATAAANPNLRHIFFTREQREQFVSTRCSTGVQAAYRRVVPKACKADVFRYCALYELGGIYLDLGVQLEANFTERVATTTFVAAIDSGSNGLQNNVIAATRHHPVVQEALERVAENARTCFYGTRDLQPTGPELLAVAYDAVYGGHRDEVPGNTTILTSQKLNLGDTIGGETVFDKAGGIIATTKFVGEQAVFDSMGYPTTERYGMLWDQRRFWDPAC